MPPRYAYWTILVDDQATAFRAGAQEDLMPTFKRLKEKHPSAKMMWFQNGKLWPSRLDAQEHMRFRGERSREVLSERNRSGESKGRGDDRQAGFRSRDREFKPRTQDPRPRTGESPAKLDWKPKGEFTPAPKRSERPEWKPKSASPQDRRPARPFDRDRKPEWKPKGSFDRDRKPEWRPKTSAFAKAPANRQDSRHRTARSEKLEWKPKGEAASGSRIPDPGSREKRKWVPKAEYKKSLGIEAKRDNKWRPGGEHRDPRQKYKDAKKAKWTKFKKTIRTKWESKKKKG